MFMELVMEAFVWGFLAHVFPRVLTRPMLDSNAQVTIALAMEWADEAAAHPRVFAWARAVHELLRLECSVVEPASVGGLHPALLDIDALSCLAT
jgi:hypothetical protein